MTWQQYSPLAAAASAAGGLLGGRQAAQQQSIENEYQRQLAAEAAANAAYEQAQTSELAQKSKLEAGASKFRGGLNLDDYPKKPEDQIAWLQKKAILAQAAGDNETASILSTLASNTALGTERLATADYTTQGRLPEAKANVGKINAQADQIRGWRTREANKVRIEMAKASQKDRAEAQRAGALAQRLATSVQIAGMREGGAHDRAQMLVDSRETMALMAQDFVLTQKMPAEQAARLATEQYQAQLKNWETQNALGQVNAAASGQQYTPTDMPTFNPTINLNTPQSGSPQVIVVPVQLPDGRVVQVPHFTNTQGAAKKQGAKTPQKPAAQPPPEHLDFSGIGAWIRKFFVGGGS